MSRLSVSVIALAVALLLDPSVHAAPPTNPPNWGVRTGLAQELFTAAHKALGSGGTFTPAACSVAEPLLDRALALLDGAPIEYATGHTPYTALVRGYCYAVRGQDVNAAQLFRLAEVPTRSDQTIVQWARACLATQYDNGRGVPQDREKALALYMLSAGASCPLLTKDPVTEAADTLLSLDPSEQAAGDSEIYLLLERGQARHWWRAVKLFEHANRNSGNVADAIKMAMRGLYAGGDTAEDDVGRKALNLKLGSLFERGNKAIALGYYLAAASPEGRAEVNKLVSQLGYKLILRDAPKSGVAQ